MRGWIYNFTSRCSFFVPLSLKAWKVMGSLGRKPRVREKQSARKQSDTRHQWRGYESYFSSTALVGKRNTWEDVGNFDMQEHSRSLILDIPVTFKIMDSNIWSHKPKIFDIRSNTESCHYIADGNVVNYNYLLRQSTYFKVRKQIDQRP